jgi:hypothetical protein
MPVVVQPDGHTWGNSECPPEYVILKIPGVDPSTVVPHTRPWATKVRLDVLSSTPSTDTHTIRVSAVGFNPNSGEGKLTRAKVEGFLLAWGATGVSVADNAVTFDIRIIDAITSTRFWGELELDGVSFSEQGYTPTTGTHRISLDYSGKVFESAKERTACVRKVQENATLVSHDPAARVIVLDVRRATVRDEFMEEVKRKSEGTILRRRRFRISESLMAEAEAAGGILSIDSAKYSGGVIDIATE